MTISTATPDPGPGDIARGLAALERYVADHAPVPPPPAPHPPAMSGETKRVRQLAAEVAEAHALAALQDDDTPLIVETAKVRKRRRRAYEAARLYELAQAPTMLVYQTVRVRRLLITTALIALALALAWSTAGVQRFAADDAKPGTAAWLSAWLVEPFLSLALLVVVGARAYLGTRGVDLHHRTVTRVERLFLGLTATMNAWPYLPGIAETFSMANLVLHLLGPIVAVAIVTVLPIILAAFAGLSYRSPTGGPTGPTYRENTAPSGVDIPALTDQARTLIASGELPATPSATRIQRTLRCGMDAARAVRDALAEGGEHG
ncbi:hypothetical protein [Planobispora longispora]|uniref:Conjugal transfer protein TraI n=1 Tax=Planobispora longispora TaxID=28887 RepID=A0A8J3RU47_9ACTN|nr:hypothetical protein [Planobispora longispora]BFE88174.1 hypothetical protein GCM10020093_107750 [Planobispora longispora]GIH81188.1 hypothetical protein Plo01_76170 [Planobispora longispora]